MKCRRALNLAQEVRTPLLRPRERGPEARAEKRKRVRRYAKRHVKSLGREAARSGGDGCGGRVGKADDAEAGREGLKCATRSRPRA
jgi:hypothetical protein